MKLTLRRDPVRFLYTDGRKWLTTYLDMLGFKLEMPRREGSVHEKIRPIYLDLQVRGPFVVLDLR